MIQKEEETHNEVHPLDQQKEKTDYYNPLDFFNEKVKDVPLNLVYTIILTLAGLHEYFRQNKGKIAKRSKEIGESIISPFFYLYLLLQIALKQKKKR